MSNVEGYIARLEAERDALRAEVADLRDERSALWRRRDQLFAEVERMRPVYEAAKAWRESDDADLDICNPEHEALILARNDALVVAVDAAIAKEPTT